MSFEKKNKRTISFDQESCPQKISDGKNGPGSPMSQHASASVASDFYIQSTLRLLVDMFQNISQNISVIIDYELKFAQCTPKITSALNQKEIVYISMTTYPKEWIVSDFLCLWGWLQIFIFHSPKKRRLTKTVKLKVIFLKEE